jgi:hypothetical protein
MATRLSEDQAAGNAAPSIFRQIGTQQPLINHIRQSTELAYDTIVAGRSGSGSGDMK